VAHVGSADSLCENASPWAKQFIIPALRAGASMKRFIEGLDRTQTTLLPDCIDDYVGENNPVRAIDAFIDMLDLAALGFDIEPEDSADREDGGRHPFRPGGFAGRDRPGRRRLDGGLGLNEIKNDSLSCVDAAHLPYKRP
jgi:hypothetical protein